VEETGNPGDEIDNDMSITIKSPVSNNTHSRFFIDGVASPKQTNY